MSKYALGACPACGGKNAVPGDCGYSSFNVGWVECGDCGFRVTISPCGCDPRDEILAAWKRERHDYPIRQRALKKLTPAEKRVLGLDKEEK